MKVFGILLLVVNVVLVYWQYSAHVEDVTRAAMTRTPLPDDAALHLDDAGRDGRTAATENPGDRSGSGPDCIFRSVRARRARRPVPRYRSVR